MTIYRRFVRAKKGMSTIFGGLFFIILILMGFNLMLWGFIQYDNYNSSLFKMNQNDQLATSENLVPASPGAQNLTSTGFNIPVNNLGGTTVSIARIYISNISPTGGTHCTNSDPNSQGPCIVDTGSGTQNCAGNGNCFFTNGNVAAGVINQLIHVTGVTLNDGSGYKIILSSTRGRLFSFFYPWPVNFNTGNLNLFRLQILQFHPGLPDSVPISLLRSHVHYNGALGVRCEQLTHQRSNFRK